MCKDARSRNRPVELRSIMCDETLHAGWTEPLGECVARAASVFGQGDAARYYREQEAIVARFQAIAGAMDRIEEARETIRQGARGPHKGAFRL